MRKRSAPPKVNNVLEYIEKIEEYWFHGPQQKFARDAGIHPSTLSRIANGVTNPRYADICKIVAQLEKKLGQRIDPREIYEP